MDSQANNTTKLYETSSQPDTGQQQDAYTFLEFNTQGAGEEEEDFNYHEYQQQLSQPIRSSLWPTPSDSVADATDRALSDQQSDASPVSASSGKGRAGGGNQAAVEALAAGMSGLNFEESAGDWLAIDLL